MYEAKKVIQTDGIRLMNNIINHDEVFTGKLKIIEFKVYDDLSAANIVLSNARFDYIMQISIGLYGEVDDHDIIFQIFTNEAYLNNDDELYMLAPSFEWFDYKKAINDLLNSDFSDTTWYHQYFICGGY